MEAKDSQVLVNQDFKKWLLYSLDNQNFDTYYDLYKALQSRRSFGIVALTETEGGGFLISLPQIKDILVIDGEQRKALITYLIDNYFHTENIDELRLERTLRSEKDKNHVFLEERNRVPDQKLTYKIKPHPKESTYFNIRLSISIVIYTLVFGVVSYIGFRDATYLLKALYLLPLIGIVFIIAWFFKGIFIGLVRGGSIRLTRDQYPELYRVIEEQAHILQVAMPEVFISCGTFNAFVTRFSRGHVMMIFSEVVETTLNGNFEVFKFVTAHELCHIKRKHLAKEKYIFPARLIPFLGLAYSRGCEYTCDRTGFHFSPAGAIEGILILTIGKEIHAKFNTALHIQDSVENEGFWTWISEKFLSHPHPYKRLIAIKQFSKYN